MGAFSREQTAVFIRVLGGGCREVAVERSAERRFNKTHQQSSMHYTLIRNMFVSHPIYRSAPSKPVPPFPSTLHLTFSSVWFEIDLAANLLPAVSLLMCAEKRPHKKQLSFRNFLYNSHRNSFCNSDYKSDFPKWDYKASPSTTTTTVAIVLCATFAWHQKIGPEHVFLNGCICQKLMNAYCRLHSSGPKLSDGQMNRKRRHSAALLAFHAFFVLFTGSSLAWFHHTWILLSVCQHNA